MIGHWCLLVDSIMSGQRSVGFTGPVDEPNPSSLHMEIRQGAPSSTSSFHSAGSDSEHASNHKNVSGLAALLQRSVSGFNAVNSGQTPHREIPGQNGTRSKTLRKASSRQSSMHFGGSIGHQSSYTGSKPLSRQSSVHIGSASSSGPASGAPSQSSTLLGSRGGNIQSSQGRQIQLTSNDNLDTEMNPVDLVRAKSLIWSAANDRIMAGGQGKRRTVTQSMNNHAHNGAFSRMDSTGSDLDLSVESSQTLGGISSALKPF